MEHTLNGIIFHFSINIISSANIFVKCVSIVLHTLRQHFYSRQQINLTQSGETSRVASVIPSILSFPGHSPACGVLLLRNRAELGALQLTLSS